MTLAIQPDEEPHLVYDYRTQGFVKAWLDPTWQDKHAYFFGDDVVIKLAVPHTDSHFGTQRKIYQAGKEPFLVREIAKFETYARNGQPGNIYLELWRKAPGDSDWKPGWAITLNPEWLYLMYWSVAEGWVYLFKQTELAKAVREIEWSTRVQQHGTPRSNAVKNKKVALENAGGKVPTRGLVVEPRFLLSKLPSTRIYNCTDPEVVHPYEVSDVQV